MFSTLLTRLTQSSLAKEIIRFIPAFALLGYIFYHNMLAWTVYLSGGFFLALVVVSHLARRFLWPYAHMEELYKKSLEDPRSSAIVFVAKGLMQCFFALLFALFLLFQH